ncbi:MAG: hypothetical protein Fur0024_0950 [Patescibacteria group bacterium]
MILNHFLKKKNEKENFEKVDVFLKSSYQEKYIEIRSKELVKSEKNLFDAISSSRQSCRPIVNIF